MSQRLTLDKLATSDDERIANILLSWKTDPSIEAGAIRWAVLSLQNARAALVAISKLVEAGNPDAARLLALAREGLELAADE